MLKNEVFEKVREIISESLDIDASDIKEESRLFTELNIESVDILEITFRVEQEFDFTMGEGEFWNVATFLANKDELKSGLDEEAIQCIKKNFDFSDDIISSLKSPFDIYDYITVNDLCNYIINVKGL